MVSITLPRMMANTRMEGTVVRNVAAPTVPALATLAPTVYASGAGSFFWSLMVKPAYLMAQRPNGTFNGLFHEDGSVYSLEDYQAVAGQDKTRPVKAAMPDWYVKSLKDWDH